MDDKKLLEKPRFENSNRWIIREKEIRLIIFFNEEIQNKIYKKVDDFIKG